MKILIVLGTRPEAIKLAPVIKILQANALVECLVCVTAQHREMLDQVLKTFDISPDFDLNLMRPNQSLSALTASLVKELDAVIKIANPDAIVVQGDTATAFIGALTAYYNHKFIVHVEAGLRTFNINSPWPEEGNRRLISVLADLHLAPTEKCKANLINEGISPNKIFVTGNTVISALFDAVALVEKTKISVKGIDDEILDGDSRIILITAHRRESYGDGIIGICRGILRLAQKFPTDNFIFPVHMNPQIREKVYEVIKKDCLPNVYIIDPLDYLDFIKVLKHSYLIITDSGGIQEEAPSLGKPVLVIRDTTEREEGVIAGTVKLIGTKELTIFKEACELLENQEKYNQMSNAHNPYGDAASATKVCDYIFLN